MAKISASLPDELKARLDAYIKEHPGTGVSDVVQNALEQFLSGGTSIQPPAPPPVTPPTPLPSGPSRSRAITRSRSRSPTATMPPPPPAS